MTKKLYAIAADPPEHGLPFNQSQLHWIAFYRDYNGAEKAGAIVKFGGRLYINPEAFLAWMATQPRISPPTARTRMHKKSKQTMPQKKEARRERATA
jgi:hypothetical protein